MPKIVDHDQYRKDLIHKAFDLFAEKGYAITMRQIAQELGVSTGTLYHYFSSKEALFEQVVIEVLDQDLMRITDQIKQAKTLTERIEVGFQFLEDNQEHFFKNMMICMDYSQHQNREGKEYSQVLRQAEENSYAAMAALLEIDDPEILAFVSSFVDGLILGQMYDSLAPSISRQGKLLAKMLTAYLQSKSKQSESK